MHVPIAWPGGAQPEEPDFLHVERRTGRPDVYCHYHQMYELVLLRGAAGYRLIGSDFRAVTGLDLTLSGPNLPHGWSPMADVPEGPDQSQFLVVLFSRQALGLELLARPEMAQVRRLLDRSNQGLHWSPADAEPLAKDLFALAQLPPARRLLGLWDVLARLGAIEAQTLNDPQQRSEANQIDHERLTAVLELVQQRSSEPIALSDAAACVHLSVPAFTRFFRRMTGMSFIDYLNEWRIRRACRLLETTDQRILEVALACGFGNLSHFNRQFKRRRNCTPRQYRSNSSGH